MKTAWIIARVAAREWTVMQMGHISTRDMFEILSELRTTEGKLDDLMRYAEDDLVKPVRCRECQHYRRNAHDRGVDDLCDLWNLETRANEYCSQGERGES